MADAGILISDGSVNADDAAGTALLFSAKYPFAKIDSTMPTSLQNIVINFTKDPPNPDGTIATTKDTVVYSFAHGYNYVPKLWMLFQRTIGLAVQTGASYTRDIPYGYEGNAIAVSSTSDFAQSAVIKLNADKENVQVIVTKNYQATAPFTDAAVNLVNYQIKCRVYVFVEDMLGSS